MTLTGTDIDTGSNVYFDGIAATNVVVMSQSVPGSDVQTTETITATLPAAPGVQGPVAVRVVEPIGTSVSRSDLFAYYGGMGGGDSGMGGGDSGMGGGGGDSGMGGGDSGMGGGGGDSGMGGGDSGMGGSDGGQTGPVLSSVSPSPGPTTGGITVTLTGAGFVPGATVSFGGVPATNVQVVSATQITVTLPAQPGKQGKVTVTVTLPDGKSVSRSDLFAYYSTTLNFGAPGNFGTSTGGNAMAIGDINRDGNLDLAITRGGANSLTVLLGTGHGVFGQPLTTTVVSIPESVALGDFNGDGIPDLVTANDSSNNASVLLGNGDGSFQVRSFPADVRPISVAVGDVNGDHLSDIVVANYTSLDVSVLQGNGDGTFKNTQNFTVTNGCDSVALGDLNGDGNLDIVVVDANSQGSVLLGNGNGIFQAAKNFPTGCSQGAYVAIGDLNGDGKPDVEVACKNGVSVSLGTGDGSLGAYKMISAGPAPSWIAIGDLNGDGKPDLTVGETSGASVSVLLGYGDGTFQTVQNFLAGTSPGAVVVADLDGDGKPDIATTNSNGTVSVLINISQ